MGTQPFELSLGAHNELCYKSLVNAIFFMFQQMVVVNTATSWVINIDGQYVILVVGVIEHQGWCSPKG